MVSKNMPKPTRKYTTEHAFQFINSMICLIYADQISDANANITEEVREAIRDCHIYMICARPSLKFEALTLNFKQIGDRWEGTGFLVSNLNGKNERYSFSYIFSPPPGTKMKLSDYPYREIHAVDEVGEMVRFWPAHVIAMAGCGNVEAINSKVLYVGQSLRKSKNGSIDRLRSHSTLQKILADVSAKSPDLELSVVLLKYVDVGLISSIDGRSETETNDDEDDERTRRVVHFTLSKAKITCLVEAGLIRYFEPDYNEIYKSTFPARNQKIIKDCLDLDMSGIIIELSSDDIRLNLFSDKQALGAHHIAHFNFHDPATRTSFTSLTGPDGTVIEKDFSGPVLSVS